MLIRFHASDGKDRENGIASALAKGAKDFGDNVQTVPNSQFKQPDPSVDVACCFGVKGSSRAILEGYLALGKRVLMFDKALIRTGSTSPSDHFRVGLDESTPAKYQMRLLRTWERWERLRIDLHPLRPVELRGHIVFAGSSQKYCDFNDLGDANEYARAVLAGCHTRAPKRPLVYRPKPSFNDFIEIPGALLSRPPETMLDVLASAHVVITHGSSAAIDAVINGVPAVALSRCAASPVTASRVEDVKLAPFPSDEARFHWACNLAWCQWTLAEFASGEAWEFLRGEIAATAGASS